MSHLTHITEAEESALALEFAESIHAGSPSPAADHTGERINLVHCLTHTPAFPKIQVISDNNFSI